MNPFNIAQSVRDAIDPLLDQEPVSLLSIHRPDQLQPGDELIRVHTRYRVTLATQTADNTTTVSLHEIGKPKGRIFVTYNNNQPITAYRRIS